MNNIQRALLFAKDAHAEVNHIRKYTKDPYIWHSIAVAGIVSSVFVRKNECNQLSQYSIMAALLHDVLEDTIKTIGEIKDLFGEEVATMVNELTDVSRSGDGNRKARKMIDLEHTASASIASKNIKLSDIIHNTSTVLVYDPEFAKIYLPEKRNLLDKALKEGDSFLWHWADRIIRRGI